MTFPYIFDVQMLIVAIFIIIITSTVARLCRPIRTIGNMCSLISDVTTGPTDPASGGWGRGRHPSGVAKSILHVGHTEH